MNNGRAGSSQQFGPPQEYGLQHISLVPVHLLVIMLLLWILRYWFLDMSQAALSLACFSNVAPSWGATPEAVASSFVLCTNGLLRVQGMFNFNALHFLRLHISGREFEFLTNVKELNVSGENDCGSSGQELLWRPWETDYSLILLQQPVTEARHNPDQIIAPAVSLDQFEYIFPSCIFGSVLIYSHLHLGPPNGFFPSVFSTRMFCAVSSHQFVTNSPPGSAAFVWSA